MADKILIVDDDLETLKLIGVMLQRQGYEIVAASNGAQAIALAQKERPDLIVLDVMMPDKDGYQVTQELRKDSFIGETPILMFTAKSQVDDKVAGYDAGADDYLTKPVHPAELAAHIKALLSRARSQPQVKEIEPGYIVGVVGCKGGLGVSTLVLNLAASYAFLTKTDVVAAELRAGQGTWITDLGFTNSEGLSKLLKLRPVEISPEVVEENLVGTSFGIRLLLAPIASTDLDYAAMADKLPAIVRQLAMLAPTVILDIGSPFLPGFDKLCSLCSEIIVVTDSTPSTVKRTNKLIEEVRSHASGAGKTMDLVLFNRTRSDVQMSSIQITEALGGTQVGGMIPPSPELAFQASLKHTPLVALQPDGLLAQQFTQLAEIIHARVKK